MAKKTPQKPVFPREEQRKSRPKTPSRPDYHSGAAQTGQTKAQTPARPVYDYNSEASVSPRKAQLGRMDYTYRQAQSAAQNTPRRQPGGALDAQGLPQRRQPEAQPFVNTQSPSRVPPAPAGGRPEMGQPHKARPPQRPEQPAQRAAAKRPPRARPQRQPAWHASAEQEVPLKPRPGLYDQKKDAPRQKNAPKPKRQGFLAARAEARRRKKAQRAAHPPTPAELHRRRIRRNLITAAIVAVIITAGCVVSAALLFKIETVSVVQPENGTRYTDSQITEAFGTPLGENIFSFRPEEAQQRIAKQLPYLEMVEVRRVLPGTVTITVTEAIEAFSMPNEYGGRTVLSPGLKVLRVAPEEDETAAALIQIVGGTAQKPDPGDPLVMEDEDKLAALRGIVMNIQQKELLPINQIDLTDMLELSFIYDGRIKILLGTANDMAYKIDWAWRLVTPQEESSLPDTAQGTLDVSRRNSEGRGQAAWRAGAL